VLSAILLTRTSAISKSQDVRLRRGLRNAGNRPPQGPRVAPRVLEIASAGDVPVPQALERE